MNLATFNFFTYTETFYRQTNRTSVIAVCHREDCLTGFAERYPETKLVSACPGSQIGSF